MRNSNKNDLEEADFSDLFRILKRNKKIFLSLFLSSVFFAIIVSLLLPKKWQGEFQIVLETEEIDMMPEINSDLQNIAGLDNQFSKLKTEVGVLRSPSNLLPIFNSILDPKTNKNILGNGYDDYKKWVKDKISIELEEGTSILNISYKDTNKELILPVLNKISKRYQEYSGEERERRLELINKSLQNQIDFYKAKSIKSLREAQQFAMEQDLTFLSNLAELDNEILNSINIEVIRVEAANKIRILDNQLDKIDKLDNEADDLMYIAGTIPSLEELSKKLKLLDANITKAREKYRDNDKVVQELFNEKKFFTSLLKRQVKGTLIAEKEEALSVLKSSERSKGVILKYIELINISAIDREVLNNLENKFREILIEQAKYKDPWKLITVPTILPKPVGPRKRNIVTYSSAIALIFSFLVSYLYDKQKGLVYSLSEVKTLRKWPLLTVVSDNKDFYYEEKIELIGNSLKKDIKGSIAILEVGNIDENLTDQIRSTFVKIKLNDLKIVKSLIQASECMNLFLLISLGKTKREEIYEINEKLDFQKVNLLGVLVDSSALDE